MLQPLISLLLIVPLALVGCGVYPPQSPLPKSGWRCAATDSDGNRWFYNDEDKATAIRRAVELCRDGSPYLWSCAVESGNCTRL
jgi:hypothetical protein